MALRREAGLPAPAGTSRAPALTPLHLGVARAQLAPQGGSRGRVGRAPTPAPLTRRVPEHQPAPRLPATCTGGASSPAHTLPATCSTVTSITAGCLPGSAEPRSLFSP